MIDCFERLGLPRRFSLDLTALETAFLDRSRAVHPDFHHSGSQGEQAAAEALTAAVNEAYTTLKDPFRRAEHLLTLLGGPSAAEVKEIPPAFLMEMMDLREEIERADAAGKLKYEKAARQRLDVLFNGLVPLFDRGDLIGIRKELNAAKYLRGILRDLRDA
ncbi:MAG: Fe-S protein assembly co-chaperone HscB [Fimbriiglobus sp.]|jgi:molecular chaperone HscB|nr:Fe-S protein assembly co-chaperone HscB [Fimbriiglobus sp.]